MSYKRLAGDDEIDELTERIFAKHPQFEYLHAPSTEACCYICKSERVENNLY